MAAMILGNTPPFSRATLSKVAAENPGVFLVLKIFDCNQHFL